MGAIMALLCLSAGPAWSALEQGACTVRKEADIPARMRDGTMLLADIYRPQEAGTYPVILMRMPYYDKEAAQTYVYAKPEAYARTVTSSSSRTCAASTRPRASFIRSATRHPM